MSSAGYPVHGGIDPRLLLPGMVAFLIALALYLYSIAPAVSYGGDSGELIACAYTLGVAHPTGYPLYRMTAKLFTLLPIGDVAFRANLMSAIFAALTVFVLYWILSRVTRASLPAMFGTLSFACGYAVWSQAVIADVYTFSVFLGSLALLLALLWRESRDIRWLYGAGFILGLSISAHGTVVTLTPAFILWFLVERRKEPVVRTLVVCALCFAVGALVLLYLPLRAMSDPPINWGNPRTWQSFIAHITARQFGGLMLGTTLLSLPRRLETYGVFVFTHFGAGNLFLLLIGAVALARQNGKAFFFYTSLLLINSGFFLAFNQAGAYFQLLPSFLVYCIFVGIGCYWLAQRLHLSFRQQRMIHLVLPAALWIAQVRTTLPDVNMRGNYRPKHDVAQVLRETPKGAVVIAGFDQILFTLWYYRFVEGVRKDLVIEHTGDIEKVIRQHHDRSVFCPMFPPQILPAGYYFDPMGTYGVIRRGRPMVRFVPSIPHTVQPVNFTCSGKELLPLSLLAIRLHPTSLRREAMSTLYTYWRPSQPTSSRHFALICDFRLKGTSLGRTSQQLSLADRRLIRKKSALLDTVPSFAYRRGRRDLVSSSDTARPSRCAPTGKNCGRVLYGSTRSAPSGRTTRCGGLPPARVA